jgi:sugar phosphate isomerase/epimerase
MARLSISEVTTFRWTFEQDATNYAQARIGAMGVWRQKLSDIGEAKAEALLRQLNLRVSNLLWAGGFTGSDGRTFADSVEDGVEAVRLAGDLNAGCVVVYSGARAGHTHNHARRLLKDALKEMTVAADESRVDLAIEPMHPGCAAEWTFLHTLDDALAMVDTLAHPRLKLVFDTYHLGFDSNVIHRIPSIVDRIAVVHLGDAKSPPNGEQNRCLLGQGVIPLRTIVGTLCEAGYDGYFDVELIGEEIEAVDYAELLRHSRDALEALFRG